MKPVSLINLLVLVILAGSCTNSNVDSQSDTQTRPEEKPDAPSKISSDGGWQDLVTNVAGQVFLGAEKGIIFYAFDMLTYPEESVELTAKLQKARILEDIPDVTIGFYKDSELIGTAKTDDTGRAVLAWTPPEEGDYFFTAKITDVPYRDYKELLQLSPAPFLVAARKKETPFVVIDLDHTVVASNFFRVLIGGAKPMADSVKVTKRIVKEYSIIYLTQRPALLTHKSKSWLQDNHYPTGALLLGDLNESLADSGSFKSSLLARTKKAFPQIRIGIGDKPSDAQAYLDNGLVAYLLPHYKDKAKDLRKRAEQIRQIHDYDQDRLHVVQTWSQIEAGIFKGKKFPPDDFVRYLQQRAQKLEEDQRKRKEQEEQEEKEDDDD